LDSWLEACSQDSDAPQGAGLSVDLPAVARSNIFRGHAGWNQSPYTCNDVGHLGYIGVFEVNSSQYSRRDIDNTNWQGSVDTTQTAVSFYARD